MTVTELNDRVAALDNRQDLVAFVSELQHDLAANPAAWENFSLDHYLDALVAWLDGPDESFAQFDEPVPLPRSWRFAGKMLLAAKYYEERRTSSERSRFTARYRWWRKAEPPVTFSPRLENVLLRPARRARPSPRLGQHSRSPTAGRAVPMRCLVSVRDPAVHARRTTLGTEGAAQPVAAVVAAGEHSPRVAGGALRAAALLLGRLDLTSLRLFHPLPADRDAAALAVALAGIAGLAALPLGGHPATAEANQGRRDATADGLDRGAPRSRRDQGSSQLVEALPIHRADSLRVHAERDYDETAGTGRVTGAARTGATAKFRLTLVSRRRRAPATLSDGTSIGNMGYVSSGDRPTHPARS